MQSELKVPPLALVCPCLLVSVRSRLAQFYISSYKSFHLSFFFFYVFSIIVCVCVKVSVTHDDDYDDDVELNSYVCAHTHTIRKN